MRQRRSAARLGDVKVFSLRGLALAFFEGRGSKWSPMVQTLPFSGLGTARGVQIVRLGYAPGCHRPPGLGLPATGQNRRGR
jgi:hypothetical protein